MNIGRAFSASKTKYEEMNKNGVRLTCACGAIMTPSLANAILLIQALIKGPFSDLHSRSASATEGPGYVYVSSLRTFDMSPSMALLAPFDLLLVVFSTGSPNLSYPGAGTKRIRPLYLRKFTTRRRDWNKVRAKSEFTHQYLQYTSISLCRYRSIKYHPTYC